MKYDVSILSTNEYFPEEIIREEIPEKYLYNDRKEFSFTSTIFNSEKFVPQLIDFLFQENIQTREFYRNENAYVLDLSSYRSQLIGFENLEKLYPIWIENTGRENTMNEYGMLMDFIGCVLKGIDKKHLLMIVSNERYSQSHDKE